LQPIKRFALDGAILFSDILIPLVPMGIKLKFDEKRGPLINNPVSSKKDVTDLKGLSEGDCAFIGEALQLIKPQLPEKVTMLGFAGAPFTLASYMVEGRSSKNFLKIKSMMFCRPRIFADLMEKLVDVVIAYIQIQINNGAEAIQLFDSWAGHLSPLDYREFAHPYSSRIIDFIESRNIPVIHFVKGNAGILDELNQSKASGIGISWDISLQLAAERLSENKCLQGNLDPAALFGTEDSLILRITDILQNMKSLPHPSIFNLGHGILPETPVEKVQVLLDTVRSYR
jgi:uroporphyrinogen decarboxylase